MKRIVFADYDGTIYRDDRSVKQNVAAIKRFRACGGKFVIATGRGVTSVQGVIEKDDIPYDYLIMNNGALVANNKGELLRKITLAPELAARIVALVHENFSEKLDQVFYYGLVDKTSEPEDVITALRVRTRGRAHEPIEVIAQAVTRSFPEVATYLLDGCLSGDTGAGLPRR